MIPDETIRRRVIVHGRVQGVWFRETTLRRASAASVTGWVRNNPDGTVEAVFEGSPASVESLVSFCRTGPYDAHVARLDVVEETPEGVVGFRVL